MEGSLYLHLGVYLLSATSLPLLAAPADKTNETGIAFLSFPPNFDRAERSDAFINRFLEEVINNDSILYDRFTGPSSQLAWVRRQNTLGYAAFDRFNAAGANMFATIGLDSLRSAAIGTLPLDSLQDQWQSRFVNFVAGTIGNPQEEHIGLTSISFSAVRSSWEARSQPAGIQWGLRPWSTSPYIYLLAHAGHFDDRPLLTLEGRSGYTFFGSSKLEGRLNLQLPASFQLAGGASFDPSRATTRDRRSPLVAVTLQHGVLSRNGNPDSVFYVGFHSGVNIASSTPRQETMFVAGLSRHW